MLLFLLLDAAFCLYFWTISQLPTMSNEKKKKKQHIIQTGLAGFQSPKKVTEGTTNTCPWKQIGVELKGGEVQEEKGKAARIQTQKQGQLLWTLLGALCSENPMWALTVPQPSPDLLFFLKFTTMLKNKTVPGRQLDYHRHRKNQM